MRIDRANARMNAQKDDSQQKPDDPVARLRERAENMATTAAAMKKIADAADPLYKTLDDGQKRRLAVLTHMQHRFGGGGEGWRHRGGFDRGSRRWRTGSRLRPQSLRPRRSARQWRFRTALTSGRSRHRRSRRVRAAQRGVCLDRAARQVLPVGSGAIVRPLGERHSSGAARQVEGGAKFAFIFNGKSRGISRFSCWTSRNRFAKRRPLMKGFPDRSGRIAQLVEQMTLNHRVPGSSPGAPTKPFKNLTI